MSQDEVGSEHAKLTDLAEELTTRLRHSMPAHGVPFAGPPGNVGSVSLELSSQCKRNDELEDESLDGNDGDHAG